MLLPQGFGRSDLIGDAPIEGIELAAQDAEQGSDVGENARVFFLRAPIVLERHQIDDLPSATDQGCQE
ncbi:MAG: hypothetical protein WDO24_03910 [Pseudomonadota bacterium]